MGHEAETGTATTDLPLTWAALRQLLGAGFRAAHLTSTARVVLRSRNQLYRLTLDAAPVDSLVLKLVRTADDRFWEHHLRREHWVLELLARFWPGGAPRPFAAAFGQEWGLLVMEDVGLVSLAELLGQHRPDDGEALLLPALQRLAQLHTVLRGQQRIFQRVCHSAELDRITAASLLARLRVAHGRLLTAQQIQASASTPPPSVLHEYTERVVRPLMRGPRQMIHNSLSPLNVVLGPTARFVDWETMALAAPEFDIADLLRYPTAAMPWPAVDRMVLAVFGPHLDLVRLRLAALARALDYAGSNAQQAAQRRIAGDPAHAALADARRAWYSQEARTLAMELGLASLADAVVP